MSSCYFQYYIHPIIRNDTTIRKDSSALQEYTLPIRTLFIIFAA
jgi:hypothetical protein